MTDDFLSRTYADNHHRLSGGMADAIGRLMRTVRVSLDRLHAYEFDAPWRHDRAAVDGGACLPSPAAGGRA